MIFLLSLKQNKGVTLKRNIQEDEMISAKGNSLNVRINSPIYCNFPEGFLEYQL